MKIRNGRSNGRWSLIFPSLNLFRISDFRFRIWSLRLLALLTLSIPSTKAFSQGLPPRFTNQPLSQIVVAGSDVTLKADVAQSFTPLSYQWRKSGSLPGATNSTLVLTNIQLASGGAYRLAAINLAGTTYSSNANVTVVQVVDQSASPGADVTFRVDFRGSSIGGYQWRYNGVDIAGATSVSLSITNAQLSNEGAIPSGLPMLLVASSLPAGWMWIRRSGKSQTVR